MHTIVYQGGNPLKSAADTRLNPAARTDEKAKRPLKSGRFQTRI